MQYRFIFMDKFFRRFMAYVNLTFGMIYKGKGLLKYLQMTPVLVLALSLYVMIGCQQRDARDSNTLDADAAGNGKHYLLFRTHMTLQGGYLGAWELGPIEANLANLGQLVDLMQKETKICDAEPQIKSLKQIVKSNFPDVALLANFFHDAADLLAGQVATEVLKAKTTINTDFICSGGGIASEIAYAPELFQLEESKTRKLVVPDFKIQAKIYGPSPEEEARQEQAALERYERILRNSDFPEDLQVLYIEAYKDHLNSISSTDSEIGIKIVEPTFVITSDPNASAKNRECTTVAQFLNLPGASDGYSHEGEYFCKVDPAEDRIASSQPTGSLENQNSCSEKQTPDEYTCAEQASFGKCEADWMIEGDYCAVTCGRESC